MEAKAAPPRLPNLASAPTRGPFGRAPYQEERTMMCSTTQEDMPMTADTEASAEVTPQLIGFEAFVLWFIEQQGGRVSYIDYEKPNKDMGEESDIAERFGRPKEETDQLLDAIAFQDDHGYLLRSPFPLRPAIVGNKGKRYGTRLRVVVTLA